MTYTSATYSGELYFHYDALGNTSLITDANANPKASFQYDLHTGRLINSWNTSNLEIINLNDGITGSINLTAIRAPGLGKDITIQRSFEIGTDWANIKIRNTVIQAYNKFFSNKWGKEGSCYCYWEGGRDYNDNEGEWDEAGYGEPEWSGQGFNCREALQDYRMAKCEFLTETESMGNKERAAAGMRMAACLGRKHGCNWSRHPETTDEYDPDRVRWAKRYVAKTGYTSPFGAAQGEKEEYRAECAKELYP